MGNTTGEDNKDYYTNIKVFVGNTLIIDSEKYNEKENIEDKYKKDLAYIKEILLKALQIDNLNFLLGAGCSSYMTTQDNCKNCQENYNFQCNRCKQNAKCFDCGIPIMSGLIENLIKKEKDIEILGLKLDKTNISDIFSNNLEKLLEYLNALDLVVGEMRNKQVIYFKKDNEITADDIGKKINIIKNFIINEILINTNSKAVIELYKSFYQKIINKNRKNPINIFTTNYDVYNETALDRLNFLYNNGFSGTVERKFNPMLYKYMYVENMNLNKDVWEPVSYYFNLIKLHGSITWEKHDIEIYENINLKNDNDNKSIDEANKVMIYPSPLKDRSTLMTPYSDLFRFLENSLFLNNSTLIVIGYSFSDDHINRVIYNALANPTFRLIIFGKSENIKKLIERNDKRITIIYSENVEKINDNKKENEQNKQQSESKQVQLCDEEKQDNTHGSGENCKNAEQQPIHYFTSIVNDLLPSINDDILEKDILEQMVKSLLKENKN